jgi:hypothetical protein
VNLADRRARRSPAVWGWAVDLPFDYRNSRRLQYAMGVKFSFRQA